MSPNIQDALTPRKWSQFLFRLHRDLKGHMTEIADRAGVSLTTVHRVLTGRTENTEVLNHCVDYLAELMVKRNAERTQLMNKLNDHDSAA